jgi:hypothetical protein
MEILFVCYHDGDLHKAKKGLKAKLFRKRGCGPMEPWIGMFGKALPARNREDVR